MDYVKYNISSKAEMVKLHHSIFIILFTFKDVDACLIRIRNSPILTKTFTLLDTIHSPTHGHRVFPSDKSFSTLEQTLSARVLFNKPQSPLKEARERVDGVITPTLGT